MENSQEIRLEVSPRAILAIEPENFPKNSLPGLLFNGVQDNLKGIGLYSDSFNRMRVCVFYADPLSERLGLTRGNFLVFSGQLSLFNNATEIEDSLGLRPVKNKVLK